MKPLNRKKIDELWRLYQEDQRPTIIGKKAGVHFRTAQRYIERGDPKNNIESFKIRMKRITDAVDAKQVDQTAEDLKLVQRILNTATNGLFKTKKINGKEMIVGLKDDPKIADIDKLLRLKYFLSGEPDSRTETRLKGEVNQVILAVIAIITKYVKDQGVRNQIADELISIINIPGDRGGATESRLPN